jgi:hypothetical protein
MNFSWNPTSFQDVVRVVHTREGQFHRAIVTVLRRMGSLSCPSPAWDVHGTYRVGLENGVPTVQKLGADGSWQSAPLHAPGNEPTGS